MAMRGVGGRVYIFPVVDVEPASVSTANFSYLEFSFTISTMDPLARVLPICRVIRVFFSFLFFFIIHN